MKKISFNFKVLRSLLPVKGIIHELSPLTSAECSLCTPSCPESILHALMECPYNDNVTNALTIKAEETDCKFEGG